MKNFFKQVLATVVGLIAFGAIVTFMGIISIVGMIASGDSTPEVSNNSVMVLNLSGVIDEQGQEDFLGTLTGNTMSNLGLDNMLSAIKKAKDNMTPLERRNPDIINGSRRQRIAKGSGTSLQDVNRLLKQFEGTRKMMKMATSMKATNMMRKMRRR